MLEIIKDGLSKSVPFANATGVEIVSLADGTAEATLDERADVLNHIQSMHAGAMFTLGETVSGAAMAGALAPKLVEVRPVASGAKIEFIKIAKGKLTATAKTDQSGQSLLDGLERDGKVAFGVAVDIRNEAGELVANMHVDWHVKMAS